MGNFNACKKIRYPKRWDEEIDKLVGTYGYDSPSDLMRDGIRDKITALRKKSLTGQI